MRSKISMIDSGSSPGGTSFGADASDAMIPEEGQTHIRTDLNR
jgi:hypothetical protein